MPKISKRIISFDDAINDFMIYCTNKDLTKKTLKSYESTLKLFAKYMENDKKIFSPLKVKTKDIKEYLEFTKNKGKYSYVGDLKSTIYNNPSARSDFGKPVSLWTVNNYLRNIKVFFNWLYDEGINKDNPSLVIRQYKHSRTPKSNISDLDFNKLIKALDLTKFTEYRDYVILHLLMDTGMRIGETLSLKQEDILLDKKAIFIPCEINKGRKDRYVFFSSTLQSLLRKWLDYKERYYDTEFIFISSRGNKLNLMNFEKNLKKYCKTANLKENITCHQIRNNFAKRFLLSGGDIFILSKILGHSSVTVTEQAYLDVTTEDIRKKYYKYSPLENMKNR
ncbi:tyrosine-type recombinase/integrase [Clostridium sp. Ade.TY]|uniref:tyrosine-type recombinase/integrase n=2 Tax=Clostridium TaxID=1485 RepID=UPI0003FBED62|nr:tyrosine-type recombinase/integrase [Clostridium sp. Ade.TY]